jgi:hypothetical protein
MNANYFQEVLLPLHIKLQGLYREKCGGVTYGDDFYDPKRDMFFTHGIAAKFSDGDVFTPRTIDDSSPEASKRSLVEMCNGLVTIGKALFKDKYFATVRVEENGEYKEFVAFHGASRTEAILKALIAQEGIEP